MCQRLPPRGRTRAERLLHALLAGLPAALQHLQPLAHGAQVAGEVGDSDLWGDATKEDGRPEGLTTRAALLKWRGSWRWQPGGGAPKGGVTCGARVEVAWEGPNAGCLQAAAII